ncbi:DUF58 domain-containing protein [Flavobacterium branchiophilum]|uniref:DUF58 domain-containing protein n=2 Tax=Flavobacterium branchiophilum TaxID=55197 RepID=G2Z7A4_FLABF|nr:DUF58 domain-containing protein [Flavobacterium branchiophilum]PDS25253.1 DUF58 domain-containing protein [Flavobacterium branchiophilum]CCB69009.1 Protein of unknown function [Flavobacterium branchiophilum FL-15]
MNLEHQQATISRFQNLELLAHQVVEGFISGMHKSPFHGFSAEFAEHKVYNSGESTKHIDWKLFAKTDKLFTKRYEEETNLRCHFILDNSSSMHFPALKRPQNFFENKIGFSVLATAVLMNLLKKQRDAVGMSVFSNDYDFYAPEKGSERHHSMLLHQLEHLIENPQEKKTSNIITFLHQVAEKIHRRSMIIIFSDMFQTEDHKLLFDALQHLQHNKHKIVLFHVMEAASEWHFQYDNSPRKFVDLETGESVNVFAEGIQQEYNKMMTSFVKNLELTCSQNKIKYVPVDVSGNFEKIMTTYLAEKQSFR